MVSAESVIVSGTVSGTVSVTVSGTFSGGRVIWKSTV